MRAKIKHKKGIKDMNIGLKGGQEVEVKENKYDEVFKEKTYTIIGYNTWLPKSDLNFNV